MRAVAAAVLLIHSWLLSNLLAVEFRKVEYAGKRITVCQVDLRKESLQLFHRDENGVPFKRFPRLASWLEGRNQKLVFAMNAGMYHRDFSSVGLFVSEGREMVPLNTSDAPGNFFLKPNGVFAVTEDGGKVMETSEYPKLGKRVLLATQSGPLLVHNGRIHPAFNAASTSRLYRNGVGISSLGIALFAISEDPLNLYEFALFFRDQLHCPNALFLDGDISSLYAPAMKRSDFHRDLGPILGVTE